MSDAEGHKRIVAHLRGLADEHDAGSVKALRGLANRFPGFHGKAQEKHYKEALSQDVGKQLFAPKPKSLGQSAATAPGSRYQADLIDFAQNTDHGVNSHKYALVVQDVFTRQVDAEALKTKSADEVTPAFRKAIEHLPGHGINTVVTTDQGNEFKGIQGALPSDSTHRERDLSDLNAIAIVDRTIQKIKKGLAKNVVNTGGQWSKALNRVTEAQNVKPNSAIHGAPETADDENAQQFFIAQDNAKKFEHNQALTDRRVSAVKETGAFRPANLGEDRSFRPTYGKKQILGEGRKGLSRGLEYVGNTNGARTLLKHVQAVHRGSGEAKAFLTIPRGTKRKNLPVIEEERIEPPHAAAEAASAAAAAAPPKKKTAAFFLGLRSFSERQYAPKPS